MHLGHLFLFLSLLSLASIGVFHKIADHFHCRPTALNVAIFFWATMLMLVYVFGTGQGFLIHQTPAKLYLIASICGFLASTAILSFQIGLRHGKISTSWVVINLSTALPTILSIAIYKEPVSFAKGLGLVLVTMAILLLWRDREEDEKTRGAENALATSGPVERN